MVIRNSGVLQIGQGNVVVGATGTPPAATGAAPAADVGVITVLSEETAAVVAALHRGDGYAAGHLDGGQRVHEAHLDGTRVVAAQALDRGQLAAAEAYRRLHGYCRPPVVAVVGIAGGIHRGLHPGDVVVAHEVVYYDSRKETPGGTSRRGRTQQAPRAVVHAVNAFFADYGEPFRLPFRDPDGSRRVGQVLRGPVGCGEAVVAHGASPIRDYLTAFSDKVMAVETELGGVAHAVYEGRGGDTAGGWLAVRGISDLADEHKDDRYHDVAARQAVAVLVRLLPFLADAAVPA